MEPSENKEDENLFSQKVDEEEKRKLKAQHEKKRSIWFGLGAFGIVGWSVAIPTLLGIALGIWLDKIYPESFSWVLTFLILGLLTGCIIAWYWVIKEKKEMDEDKEKKDE